MSKSRSSDRDAAAGRRRVRGLPDVRAAIESGEPVRLLVVVGGELADAVNNAAASVEECDAEAAPAARDEHLQREIHAVVALAEKVFGPDAVSIRRVTRREMRRMAGPGEAVDAIALVGPDPNATLAESFSQPGPIWLLAGPSYPGNAGLATRTAEVSGAAAMCIDAEFDRAARRACLRASMRSDRLMPLHFVSWREAAAQARESGRRIVAIEDSGDQLPWQTDLRPPSLLVVGGETAGVPDGLLAMADARVRIPTPGFVSSYNLQAAMAIVIGEWLRQTSTEPGR